MEEAKSDNEQKKEYLKRYRIARRREKQILEEIQKLRMDKMFPSLAIDGMPKGSNQCDLSDYAAAVDHQLELLKRERLQRVRVYQEIEQQIRIMTDEEEQEVLRLRYIDGHKWEKVAAGMGYSWKQIHRIHARALMHFALPKR